MDIMERAKLINACNSDVRLRKAVLIQCKTDYKFFFNTFCWTFDPRLSGQGTVPFNLYPFQEWALSEIYEAIDKQEDLGIEKSRDLGFTWLICTLFVWIWLFKPSWNTLIGNRKESEVDTMSDISTSFEKMRFTIDHLPSFMLPPGFNTGKHMTFMKIVNPFNKNSITGESANANFARGGRYRCIFLDEFAAWAFAHGAWRSTSRSTNCRLVLSTPAGPHCLHGQLMMDPENERHLWPGRQEELDRKGIAHVI